MNIQYYRDVVTKAYPSPTWARKVMQMPDKQVIAIYWKINMIQTQNEKEPVVKGPEQLKLF